MRAGVCIVCLLLITSGAAAQDRAPAPQSPPESGQLVKPSDVDVLLGVQAVLHTADMITTSYALSFGEPAHEANPLLARFAGRPVQLVAISSAINVLQAYTIAKLQHHHPKIALWWARALVGVETWATINNINAVSDLQRQSAGRSPR
jgi:hypothetical protein